MKYKLLVLDVDGTLLNDEKEITPRTLATLLKVQQMGVHIVLASGRPTYGILPLAKKLELGTMADTSCPITAHRSLMPKMGKYCSNGVITPKCCLIWRRKPVKTDLQSLLTPKTE